MKRLLVGLLIALGAVPLAGLSGTQSALLVYAVRSTPKFTMDQVRAMAAKVAATYRDSSYGTYQLAITSVGPFTLPISTPTNAQGYGDAALKAAMSAGAQVPCGTSVWIWSDIGHYEVIYNPITIVPCAKRGPFTDGKEMDMMYGYTLDIRTAFAEVIPNDNLTVGRPPNNPFDPYTPMGYMSKGGFNAHERLREGWLATSQVITDDPATPSAGTKFLETTEWPLGTGRPKLWHLSNSIEIDVRNFGLNLTLKRPPSIVTLHIGDTLLDLDPLHTCRWYTLLPGQVYTRGDGLGIRTDNLPTDGSGAQVTVFPYTGLTTASCPLGTPK